MKTKKGMIALLGATVCAASLSMTMVVSASGGGVTINADPARCAIGKTLPDVSISSDLPVCSESDGGGPITVTA